MAFFSVSNVDIPLGWAGELIYLLQNCRSLDLQSPNTFSNWIPKAFSFWISVSSGSPLFGQGPM